MDSHTKIIAAADQWAAAAAGDPLAATLAAFKPLAIQQLPSDPAVLDDALEQYAHLMLELRSDDAPKLAIYAAPDPTPAEVDAAVAHAELEEGDE